MVITLLALKGEGVFYYATRPRAGIAALRHKVEQMGFRVKKEGEEKGEEDAAGATTTTNIYKVMTILRDYTKNAGS